MAVNFPMPSVNAARGITSIFTLIICPALLLISGCSALQDLAKSVQKPQLSVTDVRVTGFNFSEIELTYDVTVDNPNALSVQMLSYGYDLQINGHTFVNGQQNEKTKVEASGESTIQVPMTLNFKELYSTVKNLANSEEAAYNFLSTFAFDLPGLGRTEIPVRKEGTIPLIHVPTISVKSLEISDLSLTQATLSLNMELDNPNAFGLNIKGFDYNLDIDGTQWAEGNALQGVTISEEETTQLQIPITLNIADMGRSVYRMLTGAQQTNYELTGNFIFGTTHPLLDQTDFTINRDGRLPLVGGN